MPHDHIVVIDPAVRQPELDVINLLSLISKLPVTCHIPALHGMESLENESRGIKGILVLGSKSSVNDGLDWQKSLGAWLKPRMESGIPTLGICFGHQFVAHLFGGRVEFALPSQEKTLGFAEISLDPNPLWDNKTQKGQVCVSHREAVTTVPETFQIVGRRETLKVESLAHKRLPVWTFQSHPEATPQFVKHMGIVARPPGDYSFGHRLVKFFLAYCERA